MNNLFKLFQFSLTVFLLVGSLSSYGCVKVKHKGDCCSVLYYYSATRVDHNMFCAYENKRCSQRETKKGLSKEKVRHACNKITDACLTNLHSYLISQCRRTARILKCDNGYYDIIC